MTEILKWVGIIALGGFFCWLMFYSFYLVLFSTSTSRDEQISKRDNSKQVKPKIVGRI